MRSQIISGACVYEAQPDANHHVAALDSVHDVSLYRGHSPRQGRNTRGGWLNPHYSTHPARLAVRNLGARRTAVGLHHHDCWFVAWAGNASLPRYRSGRSVSRPTRQGQWRLLIRLDASRARTDSDALSRSRGAWTVGISAEQAPLGQ